MAETLLHVRDPIIIKGARTHNLKNVDITLPKGKLIVVTGVSGSGKSSLAFDTVYAEGQRRYVESLSAYARQFLERMEKPDVDRIEGICPAVAIRQKNSARNPRSTVGTTTEIYDYMRLLYARVGKTFCRQCKKEVKNDTAEAVVHRIASMSTGTRVLVGFQMPVISSSDALFKSSNNDVDGSTLVSDPAVKATVDDLRRRGYGRLLIDSQAVALDEVSVESLQGMSTLDVVVDRVRVKEKLHTRLTDSVETCYRESGGTMFIVVLHEDDSPERFVFSERFECNKCALTYETPQPRLFSFNSPFGACPTCHGFGNITELDMNLVVPDRSKSIEEGAIEPWTKPHYRSQFLALKRVGQKAGIRLDVPWEDLTSEEQDFVVEGEENYQGVRGFFRRLERKKYRVHVRVFLSRYRGYLVCPECFGARLRREARDVRLGRQTISEVSALTVQQAKIFFSKLKLSKKDVEVTQKVLSEIQRRLTFLHDVGLNYLTLDRLSSTLSGGESQRINLATSLGSALVGALYVLDEPSIGLHPCDSQRLISILCQLRDQGNTVLVVEHDEEMIRIADHVIDLGLGAGEQGGQVVYSGKLAGLLKEKRSLTAKYLRDELAIPVPLKRRKNRKQIIRLKGAKEHNLKNIDISIPVNVLTCVTGVSGSGKSTLVHDVLYAGIKRAKGNWNQRVGQFKKLEGLEYVNDAILVDQTPIGRTPRSIPVTYLKAFDQIRELFSSTKLARSKRLTPSHFSFNVPGGRCEACQGGGVVRVEMQFLADVFVPCEHCNGTRFRSEILGVLYRGKSIHQILQMTVREALTFFATVPKVIRKLQVLDEIGLGYLRLGQPATTLSGGEAQRIKIAAHLSSLSSGRILYILDEPTTGLHFDDIAKLLAALGKLVESGHTLLVIEHNLDVIKTADHVIDLGPRGGQEGGQVVATGTPENLVKIVESKTGSVLKEVLASGRQNAYASQ